MSDADWKSATVVSEEYGYSVTQRVVKRSADPGHSFAPIVEIVKAHHLHWTSELPTEDGIYWMKFQANGRIEKKIIEFNCQNQFAKDKIAYRVPGDDASYIIKVGENGVQWLGPIPMPEYPEE